MLRHLHAITNRRDFWTYLVLAVASATLQAGAVLVLFPLGRSLFGDSPASGAPWVAALLGLIVAAWGTDMLAARRGLRLGISVMRTIQQRTPGAVLAWPEMTPQRAASLRTLMASGATEATSGVILLITPVVTAVAFTLALGLGLLVVSPPIGVVTLAGGLLALVALRAGTALESRAQRAYTAATEELDDRLFEFAWAQPSLRTARNLSLGNRLVTEAIGKTRGRVLKLLLWQIPGQFLFSLVLQVVLLGFGFTAWLALDSGVIDAITAATLIIVLLRVLEQVTTVAGTVAGVVAINRNLQEVRAIVETTPINPSHPMSEAPHLRARNLKLTHPDGTVGLADVNLDLAPGTVTVVVGGSGSGKTTLIRTLAGLNTPDTGTITLGGGDNPAEATTNQLRGNTAMVFQDTVLADASLRDNLLAVNPNLTQTDLDRIAEAAMLTPILKQAPAGWDTPVGELGGQLSGGERQRVGIARALAKEAPLLLIDEATSALDTRNEHAIVDSIKRIRHNHTTVVVTHRPAMLELADVVIVMREGRIIEQGTPADLAEASGEYARLLQEWRAAAQWSLRTTR